MNIFTLMGTILVDNTKANESLDKTSKEADSMMGKIGKGIGTVAKVGAVVGGAVIAAGSAITGMAMEASQATDRIDKMSAKIGVSKQAFQEWDYILGQNGMDVEKLQVGVKTLTQQMDAAGNGTKGAIENFDRLGVSWQDGSGKLRSQEEVMTDAIMALADMENGTEKARLATEMFGKAGIEMMPMLNNGAAGIEELKNRAHDLGLVLSDDAVNAGVVLGDTMDDVKDSFGMVVTSIGVELMPMVQTFLEFILANMPLIQTVIRGVMTVFSAIVGTAVDLITGLLDWINKLTQGTSDSGQSIGKTWEAVKDVMKKTFENIGELIEAFAAIAKALWDMFGDEISAATKAIWGIVSAIFTTAFNTINNLLDIFTALFKGDWEGLWTAVKKLVSDIWDGITKAMKAWLEGMVKIVGDIAKDMFNAGKKAMDNFFEGLKEPWKKVENWLNEKLGWVDRQFGKADTMGTKAQDSKGKTVNGSHANGLEYVPFDGYIAELHQGERVLTADEARRRDTERQSDTFNITIDAKNVKEFNDIVEMAKEERRLRRMGEEAS